MNRSIKVLFRFFLFYPKYCRPFRCSYEIGSKVPRLCQISEHYRSVVERSIVKLFHEGTSLGGSKDLMIWCGTSEPMCGCSTFHIWQITVLEKLCYFELFVTGKIAIQVWTFKFSTVMIFKIYLNLNSTVIWPILKIFFGTDLENY